MAVLTATGHTASVDHMRRGWQGAPELGVFLFAVMFAVGVGLALVLHGWLLVLGLAVTIAAFLAAAYLVRPR